ncbi:unannotated protein [freshwater metagenome]|uniref:Unannotated protein n=1 Tax=freshwater metagenome TaxID=449393 RepID=A0A6J5ZZC8_9ZZZZ
MGRGLCGGLHWHWRGGFVLAAPLDVAAYALGERRHSGPTELLFGANATDLNADVVGGALLGVLDSCRRDEILDQFGDLEDRDRAVADKVVGAVGRDRVKRLDASGGQIFDVYEATRLVASAGDGQRLACHRLADEGRNNGGRACARPVRDAESQDRVLKLVKLVVAAAVHLAGQLRGRVKVVWHAEVALLVNALARLSGVDPDSAGVNDALHSGAARGFEHVERAAGVGCL